MAQAVGVALHGGADGGIAIGARRYPLLLVLAIANIALHSAIGHKEYRYKRKKSWLEDIFD